MTNGCNVDNVKDRHSNVIAIIYVNFIIFSEIVTKNWNPNKHLSNLTESKRIKHDFG